MSKFLNIVKNYSLDKSFEETFNQFDTIISSSFNNSNFSTFGNFISTNPPEFILMNKGISFGRPMLAEAASTKILIRLFKSDNKTTIKISTKTNPSILVFFFVLLTIFVIKLLLYKNFADLKIAAIYFLLAVLTLGFDRFVKKNLIAGFERDLTLTSK
jgi:hypothetical protein